MRLPRSPEALPADDESLVVEKLTPSILEKQVDQLFEDFNKLADTLELPRIEENSPSESKIGIEVSFCVFLFVSCMLYVVCLYIFDKIHKKEKKYFIEFFICFRSLFALIHQVHIDVLKICL